MDARTFRLGIAFAVGSALTFGMSGPFAKALMAAGWTPNAAVTARLGGRRAGDGAGRHADPPRLAA